MREKFNVALRPLDRRERQIPDDAPPCCDHFYCSAASTQERTEVYVVPARDFPQWLVLEPLIPDEGVMLHENVPERRQKHV